MLPIVIIGADATVVDAFAAWHDTGRRVLNFPTAEAAHFALTDDLDHDGFKGQTFEGTGPGIELSKQDEWQCTVVYGVEAFGPAVTGKPELLPHTGWTIAAHHDIDGDPGAPRRMVDGTPQGVDPSTIAWQAAIKLGAHMLIDVSRPGTMETIGAHLSSRTYP